MTTVTEQTITVRAEVAQHFYEGTLMTAKDIWPRCEFPAIGRLLDAGAAGVAGRDSDIIIADILALYKYAGLVFGYYGHPYKKKNAKGCDLCVAVAELVLEAKAMKAASR